MEMGGSSPQVLPEEILEATRRFLAAFFRARGLLPENPSASRDEIRKALTELEIIKPVLAPEDYQHMKNLLSLIEEELVKRKINWAISDMTRLWTFLLMKAKEWLIEPPPYIASPFMKGSPQPDLPYLFDLQDTLIEHKFPTDHITVHEYIISAAGDIYRAMTHNRPPFTYIAEKWELLSKYAFRPGGLTTGDFEELAALLKEPYYGPQRDEYLKNLQKLRKETARTSMDEKRRVVMLASLEMIEGLIRWYESLNPYNPPTPEYHKLTGAIADYFPEDFWREPLRALFT